MNKSYTVCGVCGKCYAFKWCGFLHTVREIIFASTLHYRYNQSKRYGLGRYTNAKN